MIDFGKRYVLMTTDHAPPEVIAEWLSDSLFAAYVRKRCVRPSPYTVKTIVADT